MTNTNTAAADIAQITTDALLEGNVAALPALASQVAEQFETALTAMVARIQANHDAECAARGPYWPRFTYAVDKRRKGQRWIRIICLDHDPRCSPHRKVVGFVELGTGLLYKAATFKKPAENFTRGCIFNLPANWAVGSFGVPHIG